MQLLGPIPVQIKATLTGPIERSESGTHEVADSYRKLDPDPGSAMLHAGAFNTESGGACEDPAPRHGNSKYRNASVREDPRGRPVKVRPCNRSHVGGDTLCHNPFQ